MAHFESYHMLRKALLIAASTSIIPDPVSHSVTCVIINALFLLLVYLTKPVIYFPSSTFRGYNLFLLAELSGATATLLGSFLALIGATSTNNQQETINALGITFAVLNIIFSFSFFALFHVDTSRSSEERKVLLEAKSRPLQHDGLDTAVKDALEGWDQIMVELWKTDEDAKKEKIMEEMNIMYMRTQLVTAAQRELLKLEMMWAGKEIDDVEGGTLRELKALLEAYGVVLDRASRDYYEAVGPAFEDASRALLKSLPNVIMENNLTFCGKIVEWTGETADNPLVRRGRREEEGEGIEMGSVSLALAKREEGGGKGGQVV